MSFQAYLDNIRAKTGKTPEDFAKLASGKGLTKHAEIVAWLKRDFELGHGHANAIAAVLLKGDAEKVAPDQQFQQLFSGKKGQWRDLSDRIVAAFRAFGPDAAVAANETYVNLLRGKKKVGILQPSSARLDVGIKLKGTEPEGQFEAAGAWNSMVTHRVRCEDPKKVDAKLIAWLRRAYDAAG